MDIAELKILIVESNRPIVESICDHLGRLGIHHPMIAETGSEAYELFRDKRPDMVFLEAALQDTDGFTLAKQMRKLEGEGDWSVIIFLTSMSKDEHLERGIEAGGDDYMLKPVRGVVLKGKIRAMHRLLQMHRSWVGISQQLNAANAELQHLASTDPLTGIANRSAFDGLMDREWRRCMRMNRPMSLVMVNVDHFRQYNVLYGHEAGDSCLEAIAAQLARSAPRGTDHAARYGGDVFALILGETDMQGAKHVTHRVRQYVSELMLPHSASVSPHVSISCGICSVVPRAELSQQQLLESALLAMETAKAQGRNTVAVEEAGQP